jgi:hypothetical protein
MKPSSSYVRIELLILKLKMNESYTHKVGNLSKRLLLKVRRALMFSFAVVDYHELERDFFLEKSGMHDLSKTSDAWNESTEKFEYHFLIFGKAC